MLLPQPTRSLEEQVRAARESAAVRALDDELIAVRGADRVEWLAGMVTQDTKSLRPGEARYAAVVHVKGKLLADAWVFVRADDLVLAVPHGTAAGLIEHFGRYVIMEDVELAVLADTTLIALDGPRSVELAGSGAFATDRIGRGGAAVFVTGDTLPVAWTEAIERGDAVVIGAAAWDLARLEAGVPRWGVDFGPDNYVQEAAITPRAVSFNKGCYLGQEVVCRLEMRGHVRRQLVTLVLDDADEAPAAGAALAGDLGVVTSAARSPSLGHAVAIAMIKWDAAQPGAAVDIAGRPAKIVERPVP